MSPLARQKAKIQKNDNADQVMSAKRGIVCFGEEAFTEQQSIATFANIPNQVDNKTKNLNFFITPINDTRPN